MIGMNICVYMFIYRIFGFCIQMNMVYVSSNLSVYPTCIRYYTHRYVERCRCGMVNYMDKQTRLLLTRYVLCTYTTCTYVYIYTHIQHIRGNARYRYRGIHWAMTSSKVWETLVGVFVTWPKQLCHTNHFGPMWTRSHEKNGCGWWFSKFKLCI